MKISIKIFSVLCAAILLLTAIPFTASAKTMAEIEAEIDRYEKELEKAQQGQIDAKQQLKVLQEQSKILDEKMALIEAEMAPIQENIDTLTAQINEFELRIRTLEVEIADTNSKMEVQEKEIAETHEVLKKRLRAAYIAGETSELEIFLNATDFSDFLARTELLRQVSKHDTEIVATLQAQVDELNVIKSDLDAKRTETEEKKAQIAKDRAAQQADMAVLQGQKAELERTQKINEDNINKQNKIIATYNQNSAYYQQLLAQAEREKAEFSNSLDNDIASCW